MLELQAALGDDASEAIRQFKAETELAAEANEIFGDLVPTDEVNALREAFVQFGEEALAAQAALREEIENQAIAQSFQDQIEALETEIELLGADNEALALNAEARALAGGATAEQAARIRELTEELLNQQDALAESGDNLDQFFEGAREGAQDTLAGALADPLNEGLDELPFRFAQLLQQLAAEALAAEVFEILGNLGGGGQGGATSGNAAFDAVAGAFFGGGFQAGGQVRGGQPILVGERGPELFTPPGSGAIQPNVSINQAAQAPPTVVVNNINDPNDIPAPREEDVINIIQRNPEQIKRLL